MATGETAGQERRRGSGLETDAPTDTVNQHPEPPAARTPNRRRLRREACPLSSLFNSDGSQRQTAAAATEDRSDLVGRGLRSPARERADGLERVSDGV